METPNYKVTAHSSYSASSAASSSNALSSPARDRTLKGRIPKVILGPKIFENKVASFVNLDTVMKRNKGCCVFYVSKSKSKNKQDSDSGASFYRAPASQAKTKSKSSGDSILSGKASGMMAKTQIKSLPVRTLKMKLKKPAKSKVLLSSNGILTILNCKNLYEAKAASDQIKGIIKKSGQSILMHDEHLKLKSVSGRTRYDFGIIKLEGLEFDDDHYKRCRYTPELFPYLVYKYPYVVEDPPQKELSGENSKEHEKRKQKERKKYVTLIIFSDGRMLLKNGKNESHLQKICNDMFSLLEKYGR